MTRLPNYHRLPKYLQKTARPSKYGNEKVCADGITFDSIHERDIYLQLKAAERGGAISNLRLQVPFILQEKYVINGKTVREIKYVADFVFENEDLETEVWDAKGMKTDVYKLKKKLFECKYGIEITEV